MNRSLLAWLTLGMLVSAAGCRSHDAAADAPYAREVAEAVPKIEAAVGLKYKTAPKLEERSKDQVRKFLEDRFNESLPCGARLIRAETAGDFTTATFHLTERPGPGLCGNGTGQTAQTSFVIRDGKIVEWRRVGLPGARGAPSQSA